MQPSPVGLVPPPDLHAEQFPCDAVFRLESNITASSGVRSHHFLLYPEIAMSPLFSPLTLRSLKLPNRIVVSPMCQYCAQDGLPNAWHLAHPGQLAVSGAGMLTVESTAVEVDGRITPGGFGSVERCHRGGIRARAGGDSSIFEDPPDRLRSSPLAGHSRAG
jgi:hypothetical protein